VAVDVSDPAAQEARAVPGDDPQTASSRTPDLWREWAEDRLRRLQRVSLELNAALSTDDVAAAVIDALDSPVSAPSRSLYLLDDAGEHLDLVAQRGMPPRAAELFKQLALSGDLPGSVAVRERRTVISTGRAQAVKDFVALEGAPRSTDGFAAIPLVTDAACVGVLGIGINDELDPRDLEFLEAVAAQVAQSIVRVRLIERERRRRAELEFLAKLSDTALRSIDHVDLMRKVCRAAVPTLGDWCSLYFLPETGGPPLIEFVHIDAGMNAYLEELHSRYPFDPEAATGAPAVIRTGVTEFVPRLTAEVVDEAIASSRLTPDEAMPILERLSITSVITVPLRTKRRVVGAMQFVSAESRRYYTHDDVALAEAVAGRLAEALDAAWMADHQRSLAVALQRAFLPPRLPTIPGVEIAARYWPAGIDQVGGDFYDVFALGDDTWAMLIGDVCGTGPDAAALTGIARHTVRAAARHRCPPSDVIDWLNEAVIHSNRDQYCTACYATLTGCGDRWLLSSSAAGHPLPIVSTADGTRSFGRPGSLVGIIDQVTVRTDEIELTHGDVLVLYTDGITDLPPPHGLDVEQLEALVHQHRGDGADNIARAIRRSLELRLPDHSRRDDAALIVAVIR
jgi:serine phosphatase RsbU (regulator of sigma subunit)